MKATDPKLVLRKAEFRALAVSVGRKVMLETLRRVCPEHPSYNDGCSAYTDAELADVLYGFAAIAHADQMKLKRSPAPEGYEADPEKFACPDGPYCKDPECIAYAWKLRGDTNP